MTIPFLADENLNRRIVTGLKRRLPSLDIVTAQEIGLGTLDDPTVLEWAARDGRVLLTHDQATMMDYAYERVAAGLPMPGVIEIRESLPLPVVLDELVMIEGASDAGEWNGRVVFLPLR